MNPKHAVHQKRLIMMITSIKRAMLICLFLVFKSTQRLPDGLWGLSLCDKSMTNRQIKPFLFQSFNQLFHIQINSLLAFHFLYPERFVGIK